MYKLITYNKYAYRNGKSIFLYEANYQTIDEDDYNRVMEIIERNPDEYELVNEE